MNNYAKFEPRYKNKLSTIYNTVKLGNIDGDYCMRRNGKTNIVVAATIDHRKNPLAVLSAIKKMSDEQILKLQKESVEKYLGIKL